MKEKVFYDWIATRERYNDYLPDYYARKYSKAIKGMKISLRHKMKKVMPNKKFKIDVKLNFILKEL